MEITTFEILCLIGTSHDSMTILSVYRPLSASPTGQSFDECSAVLQSLKTWSSQLLMLSDFNLHLQDLTVHASSRFLNLLSQFCQAIYLECGILDLDHVG